MQYEVGDEIVDQVWRDLEQLVARARVDEVARQVAADLGDATLTAYVPLFVRRIARERLLLEKPSPADRDRSAASRLTTPGASEPMVGTSS